MADKKHKFMKKDKVAPKEDARKDARFPEKGAKKELLPDAEPRRSARDVRNRLYGGKE